MTHPEIRVVLCCNSQSSYQVEMAT